MSENVQGCLILALYPIIAALLLAVLLSNTVWSGVLIVAVLALWWASRRRRHARLRDTTADGLPIRTNDLGENPPSSTGSHSL
jgi:Flp pilus assembly protein TadB